MKFNIIVATDINNGIGKNGLLPWDKIKEDMKYFSKKTTGNKNNAIVMGRKTMESIPSKLLPNRHNIILSRTLQNIDHYFIKQNEIDNKKYTLCKNMKDVIDFCSHYNFDNVWVIGGGEIYKEIIFNYYNYIDKCFITKIKQNYNCDTYFPELYHLQGWYKIKEESLTDNITVEEWEYKNR